MVGASEEEEGPWGWGAIPKAIGYLKPAADEFEAMSATISACAAAGRWEEEGL